MRNTTSEIEKLAAAHASNAIDQRFNAKSVGLAYADGLDNAVDTACEHFPGANDITATVTAHYNRVWTDADFDTDALWDEVLYA